MKLTNLKSEKGIQDECRDYLTLTLGAMVVRVNSGMMPWVDKAGGRRAFSMNDQSGCSDLIVCLKGQFVAVECKRPGGKPTEKQIAFLDRVRRAGGLGLVVSSRAALIEALKAEGLC